MSREVERNRNVVQTMRRHGVFRLEDRIEVMRVPIVTDEGVDGDPEVCLGGVPTCPVPISVGGLEHGWCEDGLQ